MPSPTSIDELLDLVQKSGVVDDKRLTSYLDKLRQGHAMPGQPVQLAEIMVRDGLITNFQSEQFLQGKWRRFTLGKYKVLERLGSGGMGSVYLCEHKLMRRRVAVKVLPTAKAEDPAALERFFREARAVAALDHPNIVRAFDIDQDDKLHFLVMEFVDGSSLQEIVKKAGPMDVMRAAHYMRQAALGLQHAHDSAGLVHRDIKPGNVLVDRNGIVKILDMGLARFFHDEEDMLTKKYDENVLGTADYLAPEQALDSHSVDIRADIYSLGATFYYCLTGRTPFQEGTVAQKLIWHQTRQPKAIRTLRPEVSEELVTIIEKMMAKDPAHRPQLPNAVAEMLEPFTQTAIPPPPETEMPRLSLAAMPPGTDASLVGIPKPAIGAEPSPPPRKQWQVARPAPSSPTAPIMTPTAPRPAAGPVPTVKPVAPTTRATPNSTAPPEVRPIAPAQARATPSVARTANPPVVTPVAPRKPAPLPPPAAGTAETPSLGKRPPPTEAPTPRASANKSPPQRVAPTAAAKTAPAPPSESQHVAWWIVGLVGLFVLLIVVTVWLAVGAGTH